MARDTVFNIKVSYDDKKRTWIAESDVEPVICSFGDTAADALMRSAHTLKYLLDPAADGDIASA